MFLPLFRDFLDVAGIFVSFLMFGWVGLFALVELALGADILPIFIITWIIWYLIKKKITIKIGYCFPKKYNKRHDTGYISSKV